MSAFSSGMNENVVKTALDEVVWTNYDKARKPEIAGASDSMIFNQLSSDRAAEIDEIMKPVGFFDQRKEEQDVPSDTPRIGDQITFPMLNFDKSVDITENFFDDEQHNTIMKMMKDFGLKARRTQDKHAMQYIRDGFTVSTTADGAYVYSDAHTTLGGDTVDNLTTSALSEASLFSGIQALEEQKDQNGDVMGMSVDTLLVPMALYKTAIEITESELRSDTGNNDVNFYSSKYGIQVKTSPYLGAAIGGSDTAWFLFAEGHNLNRWVRKAFSTDLVPSKYQRNNNYIYKGGFREAVGASTYEGLYGSTGVA